MPYSYPFPEIDRTSTGCYAWNASLKVACQLALLRGYPLEQVQLPGRYPQYAQGGANECWPQMQHPGGGQTILVFQQVPLSPSELTALGHPTPGPEHVMYPSTACKPVFPGYGLPAGRTENWIEDIYEHLVDVYITRAGLPSNSAIMMFSHDPSLPAPGTNSIMVLFNIGLSVQQRKNVEGQFPPLFKWKLP